MASIVPGFEYDIFISYRHNDNRSGWVTEFVKSLQEELAATIKESVSVYFDANPHDGLLETHNIDKSLEGKLKCLIFIPIISQTYCDPKGFAWRQEFCAFNKLANEEPFGMDVRLSDGNVASRILPAKIHELDGADKALLENELGGPLRSIDFIFKSSGVNRPLTPSDNPDKNTNRTFYRDQINKVANGVKEIVAGLKDFENTKLPVRSKPNVKPAHLTKSSVGIGYWKHAKGISIGLILISLFGYFILKLVEIISLPNHEQRPLHKIIVPAIVLLIVAIVARQPVRKIGYSLMQIASVCMFSGGLMDLAYTFRSSSMPDTHVEFLRINPGDVSNQLVSLEFAILRSLGTALMSAGLGAWFLLSGPVKSGNKTALAAFIIILTVGEGNNSLQLHTINSPFYIYTMGIVLMSWIGSLLWLKGDSHHLSVT